MYSASQLDKATICCLTDYQLMRHLPKKKRILLVLLLVSTRCASPEAVVESPRNIADDPLHSLLVLRCRSLHEPTNVADGE
jgi:hypothetical protein